MKLPVTVEGEIEARFGAVRGLEAVGGGSVSQAVRVDTAGGRIFLKYDPAAPAGVFPTEAEGLARLREAESGIRVPEVLGVRDADGSGPGWLALEWVETAPRPGSHGARLGRSLAALHRVRPAVVEWGWHRDGFIGPLRQPNSPLAEWPVFWRDRRLEPQLRLAADAGRLPGSRAEWDRLFAALPGALAAARADGPGLVHGDLWGGNILADAQGVPVLIDPAAYFGHREVDLAMSELFGGFDASFYAAYREAWPLQPGYSEVRRGIYQLYYLLVHVNLFGGGYGARTAGVLRQALAAL